MNRWIRLLAIITLLSMLSLACKIGLPQKAKDIANDVSSTLQAESGEEENEVESTPTRKPKASLAPTEMPEPTVTEEFESVEIRQWASSAKASSEYGSSDWSASQAVGEPDTPDDCQDYTSAWASYDPYGVDWLEVYYTTPVVPTEITIVMTYNPSQVTDIEVIDANGERHLILEDEPAKYDCPDYMTITVEDVNFPIQGVRINLDQSILGLGWTEIDAVELVGMTVGGSAQPPKNEGGSDSTGSDPGGFTPSGRVPAPSELDAGTFAMDISGYETDNFINNRIQDQSTTSGVVIGLINSTERYVLSFFLPWDLKAGRYALNPYDSKKNVQNYSCAMYINAFLYPCTGGELVVEEISSGKATGTFWFTATSKDFPDRSVTVEGSMNQLQLIKQ